MSRFALPAIRNPSVRVSSTALLIAACGGSRVESSRVESSGVEGSGVEGSGVEGSGVEGSGVEGAEPGRTDSAAGGAGDDAAEPSGEGSPVVQGLDPGGSASGTGDDGADDEAGDASPTSGLPEPGEYGRRAPLLAANSEMAVGEVEGRLYVVGGYPPSRVTQSTVQIYDTATDAWSLGASLPFEVHHPVVLGLGGLLYSLGGQTDAGDTDRALAYDPGSDAWSELEPMPTARGAGAAAAIDGVIYVVGGRPPAGNAFEAYDVAADQWRELPDLPQDFPERNHLIAAAMGGKVYVAGGRYSGPNFASPMTAALDVYDPALGQWQRAADLPRPRGGLNGVVARGCFHVWGGEGQGIGEPNDVFPDHDAYDPALDVWRSLAPLPTPVHGVTGAGFVDGIIYIPGGGTTSGGSSGSTIFQIYRPETTCD